MPLFLSLLLLFALQDIADQIILKLYVSNSLVKRVCFIFLIVQPLQELLLFLVVFHLLCVLQILMFLVSHLGCLTFQHVVDKILSGIASVSFKFKQFSLFIGDMLGAKGILFERICLTYQLVIEDLRF